MKIVFNKVTLLSKIVALALFVALPFIGFWYGMEYGKLAALVGQAPAAGGSDNGAEYYRNVAEWQTARDDRAGFSIAYPIDFDAQSSFGAPQSTEWRMGANGTAGARAFTLAIPRAFEPQTNFIEATFVVGNSGNNTAVENCLVPDPTGGPAVATSTMMLDSVPFVAFHSADAGAGNYYETTSYRAVRGGKCWAVEYTIHSSQIANYPEEYHLTPFDQAKITDLLDRVAGTFRFL